MIAAALLVVVQASAGLVGGATQETFLRSKEDTIPVVSLAEALESAAHVDPNYVAALRQVGDAAWVRRSAWSAFLLPSVNFQWSLSQFSPEQFNVGTNATTDRLTTFSLSGSYDVFRGGAKFHELAGAGAAVDGAAAGELQACYQTALATESDFYDVIAQRQLLTVSEERVRRATEQLSVARARVLSGAAVQTDSLQLLLELTRAQVDELVQGSALTIARLQLGRRIGRDGPVDAAQPVDDQFQELPLSLASAVAEATRTSPGLLVARAQQRLAETAFKVERASYLPRLSLFGVWQGFDEDLIPDATNRTVVGASLSFPLFDGGAREIRVFRAGTARRVADAAAADAQRAAARNVTEAYETHTTARAASDLAERAVSVARENLRVQTERYTGGATTIIDLIIAQVDLAEAEVGLVQARFATRLALAGIEAILGRRLF
ncbi:MAG: TolC family protein [Gemmatimonadales bacterium]|nr:MAG: TolC family protein [Gemmatimonadales bacterium]